MAEKTLKDTKEKLDALRAEMTAQGLAGYLIPKADEWQGEYVPARAERLTWISGFTGSAGIASVGHKNATVFSDGRYTIQLKAQLDAAHFSGVTMDKQPDDFIAALKQQFKSGDKIGYDPKLMTVAMVERLEKDLGADGIVLEPVDGNLIDNIWKDQPDHPDAKVIAYPDKFSGRASADKRADIAAKIKRENAAAFIMTQPDAIAWTLNIRGSDVPHVPVALSYAIVHDSGEVDWFIPKAKVGGDVVQHIGNQVHLHDFADLDGVLAKLAKDAANAQKPVMLDGASASVWFKKKLEQGGAEVRQATDPSLPLKARKNATEQKLVEDIHVRDGVALAKFWKWVSEEAPKGQLTELSVEKKLLEFRRQGADFMDTSFDSIVGWAGNGAIVHYRATDKTNAAIKGNGLLLVDSGGQYMGATTDNTRTVAVGKPTEEMREMFTRVLKGHIAIATARFGTTTKSSTMDKLARQFLHKVGLDYGHGTGHGVGCYLSVHEGGVSISSRVDTGYAPGMLVSNEPGYYKEGEYGIRIENLVMVAEVPGCKDEKIKYKFNTVSLTPIDRRLIDVDLLDADELKWLNAYHKTVYDRLSPHLDAGTQKWLQGETAPLSRKP